VLLRGESLASNPFFEEVVRQLRERIFSRQFPPGFWIDENTLAQEYRTGRTPVREALKQLADEGLVIHEPRRGGRVVEVSPHKIKEVCSLLALLEGQGAYEAAIKIKPKDLWRLNALHEQLEIFTTQPDNAGWLAADHEFHCTLYEIGGNRCLLRIIRDWRKVIRLVGYQFSLLDSGLQQPLEEHRSIMAALRRQDAAAVKECVRDHLLTWGRVIGANRVVSSAGPTQANAIPQLVYASAK
jgi:DNA-binding GntR family transcriptional regulator